MTRWLKIAALPLCLLWLFAILAAYYWGQQAVLIFAAIGIIRLLWTALLLTLIGLSAYGTGRFLNQLLKLTFHSNSERFVYNLGVGHLILTLITLLLSLVGALNSNLFWLLSLIGAVATVLWLWRVRQPEIESTSSHETAWTTWEKIYFVALGINVSVGFLLALAPPIGWDGLSTHLVLIREALLSGKLLAETVFQRPLAGHMLYIWGYALGGDTMPQLLSYSLATLSLLAVWSVARHYFGRSTALLATVILSAVEIYLLTSAWPYADMPTAWFALLATLTFLHWFEAEGREGRAWLVLTALFAAATVSTKVNGLFLLPPLGLAIGLVAWWRWSERSRLLLDLVISAGAGGVWWLIWLFVGRSLRPAGASTLDRLGRALPEATDATSLLDQLLTYLRLPFEMTILGQQGLAIFDGRISPLFLILIPILIFLPRKPKVVKLLMLFALLELLAWIIVPQGYYQTRHLMMAFPIFAILAAYTLSRMPELDQPWFTLSGFWRVIMVVVLFVQALFYIDWLTLYNPLPYAFGFQERDTYLANNLNGGTAQGYYDMMLAIREQVEPDATVGFVRPEPRTFYCRPINCERIDKRFNVDTDPAEIELLGQEYDYLLISWAGLDYFQEFYADEPGPRSGWAALESFMTDYVAQNGELIHEEGEFSLYRLK